MSPVTFHTEPGIIFSRLEAPILLLQLVYPLLNRHALPPVSSRKLASRAYCHRGYLTGVRALKLKVLFQLLLQVYDPRGEYIVLATKFFKSYFCRGDVSGPD